MKLIIKFQQILRQNTYPLMLIKQGVLCKLVIRVNSISAYGIFREQKTHGRREEEEKKEEELGK